MEVVAEKLSKALLTICEVYYGIDTALVSRELRKACIKEIHSKYGSLTFDEVMYSFERLPIEKTSRKDISKGELMAPIVRWFTLKQKIRNERQRIVQEIEQEEAGEIARVKFLSEARHILKESVKRGEWLGTPFHANVIYREHLYRIPPAIRKQYADQSRIDRSNLNAYDLVALNEGRIFANKVITHLVGCAICRNYNRDLILKSHEFSNSNHRTKAAQTGSGKTDLGKGTQSRRIVD